MTEVISADRSAAISDKKVLFDTNIWILIEGFNEGAPQNKIDIYSHAYSELLRNGNVIISNDYVVSEFCNRCAKIEFENYINRLDQGIPRPSFKQFRKSKDFEPSMNLIKEICLNITRDCSFVSLGGHHYSINDVIEEFYYGKLDFTDIILREFCLNEKAMLMTDDGDFFECGLSVITANKRLLSR